MTDLLLPYWMAFAHAKGFSNRRKMDFLIEVVHAQAVPLDEALKTIKSGDRLGFVFEEKEWKGLSEAVLEIPNYSFLAESLSNKGINAINIMDKYVYPSVLKKNLKKDAPIIVYAKGNMDLLKKSSIAIVGARKSSPISLDFAKNVAKKAVKSKSVVVSGFAKGVDKMALDAALEYKGQSIVVLPQGIDTYSSKEYYPHVVSGDVLIMSIYHPKAQWSVGLAMDRNKIIYGLAQEIYAAESGDSGGTWEGVLNGLKRERKVFVRNPEAKEKNANLELIRRGATPVDFFGDELNKLATVKSAPVETVNHSLNSSASKKVNAKPLSNASTLAEPAMETTIVEQAISLLKSNKGKGIKVNELADKLHLDEKMKKKVNAILSNTPSLRKEKRGRFNFYYLTENRPMQGQIF